MTHQITVKEINNKLSELTLRFEKLSLSNEIHLIDVDILLGMMREIYEKTSLLKEPVKGAIELPEFAPSAAEQHKPESIPDSTPTSKPDIPEPVAAYETTPEAGPEEKPAPIESSPVFPLGSFQSEPPQPETEEEEIQTTPPQQEFVQNQPEVIYPQPEVVKQETEMVQPKAEYPIREPEVKQPSTPEPVEPPAAPAPSYYPPKPAVHQPDLFGSGSLSDKYKTEAPSINDKITTGKPDHTLADKMNLVPISDIKSAIGINEKFQFINELFDGSSQVYNEAIALLNSCTGAETAHTLLRDFQLRHHWDTENKVYLKFKEYMVRRYLH